MWTSRMRTVVIVSAVTCLVVAAGYAQSQTAAPTDPVAAEIRALRADLNQHFEATMRGQLLVARLQVQEQRINSILRQLQEVDAKLRENETSKRQMEEGLKMFGKAGESEEGGQFFLGPIRAGMETATKTSNELKQQQDQLRATYADEQARWVTINARLEELEQAYGKPAKPVR